VAKQPDTAALFSCQDELFALFESLVHVMFCAKDANGLYCEVNGAFVRRTGRASKRDVIGRTAHEIFSEERAAQYEEQDRRVLTERQPLRNELELIRRPDGNLGWYLTTKLPVVNAADQDGVDGRVDGIVSVSRDLQTPTSDGIVLESLQHVVSFVSENLGTAMRVVDLASAAGCTSSQLNRRMGRVFGLSATQYILRVRVDRAMELLAETQMPLAQVAAEVGFYDQPDFTRRFARITGRTPAQFRANAGDPARLSHGL